MAPKPPKSAKGLGARLKRKVGPLPVWAWAAVILGAYLAYTRLAPSSMNATTSESSDTPATSGNDTTTGSDSGAQVPSSGMGNPADQLAPVLPDYSSQFDTLAGQLQQLPTYADLGQLYDAINAQGTATGAVAQAGPASSSAAPAAAATATRATHLTQTPGSGVLKWGGKTFTTQAGFDAWAKAHGVSTAQALNLHPQARAVYSTLKPPTHKQAPKHAAAQRKAAAPVHKPAPKPKVKAKPKPKPAPKRKPKPPPRRPALKAKAKQ